MQDQEIIDAAKTKPTSSIEKLITASMGAPIAKLKPVTIAGSNLSVTVLPITLKTAQQIAEAMIKKFPRILADVRAPKEKSPPVKIRSTPKNAVKKPTSLKEVKFSFKKRIDKIAINMASRFINTPPSVAVVRVRALKVNT